MNKIVYIYWMSYSIRFIGVRFNEHSIGRLHKKMEPFLVFSRIREKLGSFHLQTENHSFIFISTGENSYTEQKIFASTKNVCSSKPFNSDNRYFYKNLPAFSLLFLLYMFEELFFKDFT